ncbi:MAG: metal-sensing transcriptional repressor [Clostridia bacterium]|nr:metal-sensing transcriptional repressor [Clostridia bacterium]
MSPIHDEPCCPDRKKIRSEEERRELMNRLKRIEGQVRGLQRMLDEDTYCPEILTQASAVQAALNGFCRTLLESHLRSCVAGDIRAGRDESIDELMEILKKLMK